MRLTGVTTVFTEIPGFISTDAATKTVDVVGDLTGIGDGLAPLALALDQNVPNPFNPATAIGFEVDRAANVTLTVYDVSGRRVRTLVSRFMTPGIYTEEWNGRDARGEGVASGVYFYRLRAGDRAITKKMVYLK